MRDRDRITDSGSPRTAPAAVRETVTRASRDALERRRAIAERAGARLR